MWGGDILAPHAISPLRVAPQVAAMPLKEASSLLTPLVASLAIHAGSLALMDILYGTAPSIRSQPEQHRTPLRVLNLRVPPALPANIEPAEINLEASGDASVSLPEGLVSLPSPYYFLPQELSRRPKAAAPVHLEYPENAPLVVKNHVVLRLLINESGIVDKVIVVTAEVPLELEALARQAFAQAKFQPGFRGETPVKSQMLIEITFEGSSSSSPPPPSVMLPSR